MVIRRILAWFQAPSAPCGQLCRDVAEEVEAMRLARSLENLAGSSGVK